MSEQNYANHRRFDPAFHVVGFTLLLLTVVLSGILAWNHPGVLRAWHLVLAALLVILAIKMRSYALRVQDRVIRLEESLRMALLLPEDLKARIPELRPDQFVGLRFASDGELADLVRQTLAEGLGNEDIKKRIKAWRPDTFRV
jgi:hypothetical protein